MQRSIAFLKVSTIVILLLIGMLMATTLSVAAAVLDAKPAFAKAKGGGGPGYGPCNHPGGHYPPPFNCGKG